MLETLSAPRKLYQVQAAQARTFSDLTPSYLEQISKPTDRGPFIGFLFNQLGRIDEAEDVFQDSCIRFLEGSSYFPRAGLSDDYSSFKKVFWGYLNATKFRYRNRDAQATSSLDSTDDDGRSFRETIAECMDSNERAEWCEPRRLRLAILERARLLAPQYFEVTKWVLLCGDSIPRYARRCGQTEKQIKSRLARAKNLLSEDTELMSLVRLRQDLELQVPAVRRGRPRSVPHPRCDAAARMGRLRAIVNSLSKNLVAVPSGVVVD